VRLAHKMRIYVLAYYKAQVYLLPPGGIRFQAAVESAAAFLLLDGYSRTVLYIFWRSAQ